MTVRWMWRADALDLEEVTHNLLPNEVAWCCGEDTFQSVDAVEVCVVPLSPYRTRAARSRRLRSCDSTHVIVRFAWSQEGRSR